MKKDIIQDSLLNKYRSHLKKYYSHEEEKVWKDKRIYNHVDKNFKTHVMEFDEGMCANVEDEVLFLFKKSFDAIHSLMDKKLIDKNYFMDYMEELFEEIEKDKQEINIFNA